MASSQWNNSPPKFTEFGPLSSDVKPSGNFLSRLLRRTKAEEGSISRLGGSLESSREPTLERQASVVSLPSSLKFPFVAPPPSSDFKGSNKEDVDSLSGESDSSHGPGGGGQGPVDQKRTLSSVLSQISNILERRSATPQTYKDSDFKQYWMPDSSCRECYDCGDKFTTFRRRHHCRICGQIFCSKCCNQELPGKVMGYRGNLRVCTYCCRVVLSCMQQSGLSGELRLSREDLRTLPQMDSVDGDSGSYQEFGWWTPVLLRRRSLLREDSRLMQRSSSFPDLVKVTSTAGNPFDFNPHMGQPSAETIQIERKLLVQDSQQLKLLWRLLQDPEKGVQLQSHRVRLRMYTNCLVGSDIVAWLEENKSASKEQAVAIGQALLDASFIEPIIAQEMYPLFQDDFTLYKPGEAALNLEMSPVREEQDLSFNRDESMEPLWVQEIESNDDDVSLSEELPPITLKIDFTDGAAKKTEEEKPSRSKFYVSQYRNSGELESSQPSPKYNRQVSSDKVSTQSDEPFPRQDSCATDMTEEFFTGTLFNRSNSTISPSEVFTCPPGWRNRDQLRDENGEKLAFIRLQKAHEEHRVGLLKQLLSQANLSLTWTSLLLKLLTKVTDFVRPDIRTEGDHMDLRKYIQIKKIPGGQKQMTSLYHGVVCTKNIAHKKMATAHVNPKILLLKGSIEYQRVENKFSSLDPQILQEREFLRMSVDKVTGVKPDVVIVEKTVSRLAQEFLLEQGITLCYNVKSSVMERIARFTQADIVNSIDGLLSRPTLGLCHTFKVKTYSLTNGEQKTLMFFDGCATHLGCTITLRGGSTYELKRVKKILNFMILAAYHSCLEVSFCMDEFALPPPAPDELSLTLEGLDSSSETEDGRRPIFSPQSNLSSAAIFQIEVASELQAQSDPMADSFLAGITQALPDNVGYTEESSTEGEISNTQNEESAVDSNSSSVPSINVNFESLETSLGKTEENQKSLDEAKSHSAVKRHEDSKETNTVASISSQTTPEKKHENKENVSPRLQLKDIPKRKSAEITELKDFSDPLHNYQQSKDESIFDSSVALTEHKLKRPYLFRKAVDGTTLSFSPYFKQELPHLETETGSNCKLRKYLPEEVYWSKLIDPNHTNQSSKARSSADLDNLVRHNVKQNVEILPAHPLILTQLNNPVSDKNVQALLSDFRARGGRIKVPQNNTFQPPQKESSNKGTLSEENKEANNFSLYERRVDCLDPANHQRLRVLFSSYSYISANAPYPCVSPWVVMMDFYGKNDITLGGFLERFCFRQAYTCPSEACDVPMFHHIRRFVHETGCIYVILRKLDNLIPGGQTNILMWSWCRKCKQVTPVVSMSIDTWSMSFAKYLDIRFHGNSYRRRASAEPCSHSLHHDHYQYFGFMGTVASFKFSPISLREISLPPPVVAMRNHRNSAKAMVEETKKLAHRGSEVYNSIFEHMVKLKSEVQHETQMRVISEYMSSQQSQRGELRELAQTILHKLESFGQSGESSYSGETTEHNQHEKAEKVSLRYEIMNEICHLKRMVAEAVLEWNAKIQDFIQQQRKLEKSKSQATLTSKKEKDFVDNSVDSSLPGDSIEASGSLPVIEEPQFGSTPISSEFLSSRSSRSESGNSDVRTFSSSSEESYTYGVTPGISAEPKTPFEVINTSDLEIDTGSESMEQKESTKAETEAPQNSAGQADLQVKGHSRQGSSQSLKKESKSIDEVEAGPVKQERKGSSVKWSLITSLLSGPGFIPVVMPFPADEHHTLPPCQSLPVIVYDQEPSSIIAYSLSCHDYHNHLTEIQNHLHKESFVPSPYNNRRGVFGKTDSTASNGEDTGKKTGGRVLSFFRGGQSARDKSPKLTKKTEMVADSVKYTPWTDDSFEGTLEDTSTPVVPVNTTETDKPKSSKQALSMHIELQFSDNSSRFYCRVYFAEQFRQLRKLIYPSGEEMFIRSISRCVSWKAKGGKSGSAFCKTRDDRFILKQMSPMEVESFEKFAPNYFTYMTEAHIKQKPTALAKILGVYRIGFRNSQTNSALKQDLLVMENLFYDRKITQTFDLKGSVRNRLVNTTGKSEDELVLLDENLLKASVDQPLYIRQHSKAVLTEAISRDTQFLSTNLVMDYSLLVGLDDSKKDLVVGIIDYIRTFTWDKKLEMVVKYTGIFGGQGKMPTVVSPELYKSRFLEAMDRYFLLVPDRWTGLGTDSDYII